MQQNKSSFPMRLLTNNYHQGHKVLTTLIKQLQECDSFVFSVAFITNSGVASIIHELKILDDQNKKGIIITTDYLMFNEPSALQRLSLFKNIELRVIDTKAFHIKGYVFQYKENTKHKDHEQYIIGSSNLTQDALTSNLEWNVQFTSYQDPEISDQIQEELKYLLEISTLIDDDWLKTYTEAYNSKPKLESISHKPKILIPNKLQLRGLHALNLQRDLGHKRSLVISATGTGKTYLSAFDARNVNPNRLLFVVHREQIARNAMESFKHVFGEERTFGMYTGNRQDKEADFIFSTIQTLSKEYHYTQFEPNTFDYIIYDEAHHIGAESYQRILDYFIADFTLAITATPERNDNNNIYEYMDHNIAFEIRLNEALEEDMLCPFHYYGISDLMVDGKLIDDKTKFNDLISQQRVEHIIRKTRLYGHSGNRVKGLMFCSRVDEAHALSEQLNEHGLNTIALSGSNSQEERMIAINRLTSDDLVDPLDYILTVDIFNEGVDIPEINQIVMLRPTQSAIIFVQQLGRGLRKIPNKDFVVVIDFIGNYNNNFFIPIALSGDRTLDQERLRKFIEKGNHTIPGQSTIHFDNVVKERILSSVRQTNFATKKFLKTAYDDLKFKLNRIPMLMDFYELGSVDPRIIIQYKPSYDEFLTSVDSTYQSEISSQQRKILTFLCKELLNSKRKDEIIILETLLTEKTTTITDLIKKNHLVESTVRHALRVLSLLFYKQAAKESYGNQPLVTTRQSSVELNDEFLLELRNPYFKGFVNDVIKTSKAIVFDEYSNSNKDNPFILYSKYTRKDVCKLLEWKEDVTSTMFGYIAKPTATPIFVTYNKDPEINKSTHYEDEIVDNENFTWYTKSNRTLRSKDVKMLLNHKKTNMKIDLFIKKDDKEKDFFYVGELEPKYFKPTKILNDHNKELPIVRVDMKFKTELHDDMLEYFEEE